MCIAELNVSLLPCRHRWYHLSRPCSPATNLANCPNKLGLSGWEIKCDFCPYCAEWNLSSSEYRLVGNDRAPAVGGLARTASLSLAAARHETRGGSLPRSGSSTSITMMAQEKNRAMNARIDTYFRVPTEAPIPSPYPGTLRSATLREADDEESGQLATSPSDTSSEGHESLRHASTSSTSSTTSQPGMFKKMRRKSKRLSLSLFK